MPKQADKKNRIRLNFEVSPKVRERLDRLQEMSDATTLTEVLVRALATYEHVLGAVVTDKKSVILRDATDGSETELLVL